MKTRTGKYRFLRDRRGAATVEFVVLFLPMIALVFTCFQVALAYHFTLTAQKAVEIGARIAAVRDPVHRNIPARNVTSSTGTIEEPCALDHCVDPGGPWTCSGADLTLAQCDAAAFDAIFQEVAAFAYLLNPEDMEITYRYARLGKAGGPFVPIIRVEIVERPFAFQFGFDLGFGNRQGTSQSQERRTQVGIAAEAIAEDLSSAN